MTREGENEVCYDRQKLKFNVYWSNRCDCVLNTAGDVSLVKLRGIFFQPYAIVRCSSINSPQSNASVICATVAAHCVSLPGATNRGVALRTETLFCRNIDPWVHMLHFDIHRLHARWRETTERIQTRYIRRTVIPRLNEDNSRRNLIR